MFKKFSYKTPELEQFKGWQVKFAAGATEEEIFPADPNDENPWG